MVDSNQSMPASTPQAQEQTISSIVKRFGDGAIIKMGEATRLNVGVIPTGSLPLDISLGVGGIPRGRTTTDGRTVSPFRH